MRSALEALPMPGTYFRMVMRAWGADPGVDHALRVGTGIEAGRFPGGITVRQQLAQVRNLDRVEAPGWGLRLGELFDAPAHGGVGAAMLAARTLREALGALCAFGPTRTPFLDLSLRIEGGNARLAIDAAAALRPAERVPLLESTVVSVQRLVRRITEEALDRATTSLAYDRPAHAKRYARHLEGDVRFAATATTLVFPAEWLDATSPLADHDLHEAVVRRLVRSLEEERPPSLVTRAMRLVASEEGGAPDVGAIAKRLGVSRRTLERRFRFEGTTCREVSDRERRDRARVLLEQSDLDVAAIGERLGYADPSNFARACRRWFGASPRALRKARRLPA